MRWLLALLIYFPLGATALTVTSLNLQWFGRGGEIEGEKADEYRQKYFQELIQLQLSSTDVFVFQEVVNVPMLAEILPQWKCESYEPGNLRHQHVAVCARSNISFRSSTIESVRLGQPGLRPALRADFVVQGKKISVIGIHLKAGPEDSAIRFKQVNALRQAVGADPVVVIGDFNTFETDSEEVQKIFGPEFVQSGGELPTYLGFSGRIFDRVWARSLSLQNFKLSGPCAPIPGSQRLSRRSFYSRFVSDHCPISVKIKEEAL